MAGLAEPMHKMAFAKVYNSAEKLSVVLGQRCSYMYGRLIRAIVWCWMVYLGKDVGFKYGIIRLLNPAAFADRNSKLEYQKQL